MTGYGTANFENGDLKMAAEIRCLNSKFFDFTLKLPKEIASLELEIKNRVSKSLVRGKVVMMIELSPKEGTQGHSVVNKELFQKYYNELNELSGEFNLNSPDLLGHILSLPDVVNAVEAETETIDSKLIYSLVEEVVGKCNEFRQQEGEALSSMLTSCSGQIKEKLDLIKEIEPARKEAIKARLIDNLNDFVGADKVDQNRFEQELIYYIEKLDINEEIVRLENHLLYFADTLSQNESQGKKLGFISQEIGREVNTIGSKANDAQVQRLVVEMKDELEKIKEQILNVV